MSMVSAEFAVGYLKTKNENLTSSDAMVMLYCSQGIYTNLFDVQLFEEEIIKFEGGISVEEVFATFYDIVAVNTTGDPITDKFLEMINERFVNKTAGETGFLAEIFFILFFGIIISLSRDHCVVSLFWKCILWSF